MQKAGGTQSTGFYFVHKGSPPELIGGGLFFPMGPLHPHTGLLRWWGRGICFTGLSLS